MKKVATKAITHKDLVDTYEVFNTDSVFFVLKENNGMNQIRCLGADFYKTVLVCKDKYGGWKVTYNSKNSVEAGYNGCTTLHNKDSFMRAFGWVELAMSVEPSFLACRKR